MRIKITDDLTIDVQFAYQEASKCPRDYPLRPATFCTIFEVAGERPFPALGSAMVIQYYKDPYSKDEGERQALRCAMRESFPLPSGQAIHRAVYAAMVPRWAKNKPVSYGKYRKAKAQADTLAKALAQSNSVILAIQKEVGAMKDTLTHRQQIIDAQRDATPGCTCAGGFSRSLCPIHKPGPYAKTS